MATSGSKSITVTQWDTLVFSWSLSSQSVVNNTSTVTWTLKLVAGSYGRISSTASKEYSIGVNGSRYEGTNTIAVANNDTKTLASGTTTIPHNADGSKSFSYSFSQQFDITWGDADKIGIISGSGTGTLPNIPRASTLGTIGVTKLGISGNILFTQQLTGAKHKITYACGSATGYVAGSASAFYTGTSPVSCTLPLSLASQAPSAIYVSVTFYLKTYTSDGTQIGTSTKTVTVGIPDTVKPTCTLSVTDPTGCADIYGGYIQSISQFKVQVTPTLAYGSPIKSYNTTIGSNTYTASSFTTAVISTSGTVTIKATVKDKRGASGTAQWVVPVIAYTQPVIRKLTVHRCNAEGVEDNQGGYVMATFSATVTSLGGQNFAGYCLLYKKSTDVGYTSVELTDLTGQYTVTDHGVMFPADAESTYDVRLQVTDEFNLTERMTSASTAFTLIHWGADGTSMAVGKLCEKPNTFDVGLDTRLGGAVYGNVLGLSYLPPIAANEDLNDYLLTGAYAVISNANAETIKNIPVPIAGRLEVANSTGRDTPVSDWAYLRQKYIPYLTDYPTYERNITRSDTNIWTYGDWVPTSLREQKILWAGGYFMTADHTIELSERISQQPNGIELVFCRYVDGAIDPSNYNHFFVSKKVVENTAGYGSAFLMSAVNFSTVAAKYLYISDDRITGNDLNNATGTNNGVTYNNAGYVLRYVIGV